MSGDQPSSRFIPLLNEPDTELALASAFKAADRCVVPWPRAHRKNKREPLYDRGSVARFITAPPLVGIVTTDRLFATQTWVLRHHVRYYLSGEWEHTGRTSADMDQRVNRYPLLLPRGDGSAIILAGHHRAMAARLSGRDLVARIMGPRPFPITTILPSLQWRRGGPQSVDDLRTELADRGLTADEVEERLRFASVVPRAFDPANGRMLP